MAASAETWMRRDRESLGRILERLAFADLTDAQWARVRSALLDAWPCEDVSEGEQLPPTVGNVAPETEV